MSAKPSSMTRRQLLAGLAAAPATAGLFGAGVLPSVARAQTGSTVVNMIGVTEAPALLSFVNTSSTIWSAHVSEGLLEFDFDMNPTPLLATEWKVSDDGLTYTFGLRKGVKFHDGAPFTSKDVKFSILASRQYHARNRSTFSKIKEVETPDDHTVILRLSEPTSFLLKAFSSIETPIVPSHLYKPDDNPLTHPNNTAPIGTGAFVFKEWVRGSHVIWTKNPHYWNPKLPLIDTLVAKFILDPSARTIAFETGNVDVGYRTPVPFRDLDQLQATGHIDMTDKGYAYNPPNCIMAEANLRDPILADLRVRQAIAHCIDRVMINRVVFFNRAVPTAAPVVPYHRDFHLAEPSPYPFDINRAKKLLAEAGHPKGISLTIDFVGDDQRVLAEFLRAAMARAGISLELRGQDMGTLIARVYRDQAYQLHLASMSNLFDPQVGVQRLYWSKNIIRGVAFSNGTGYANAEVDAWLERSAVSTDHAERIKLWHNVQRKVMQDVPNFPIVMAAWLTISNKRLLDHTINAEGFEGSMAHMRIG